MTEYLIRADDGEFLIPDGDLAVALQPRGYECQEIDGWGDYRIRCGPAEVSFSFEDPGVQVEIEGADAESDAIAEAIRDRLSQATGRGLYLVAT